MVIDKLLAVLTVPTVGHREAAAWRSAGITDFEDALQVISARAGEADFIITRNVTDFQGSLIPVMTRKIFLPLILDQRKLWLEPSEDGQAKARL